MVVVPARVHDTHLAAVVLGADLRRERQPGLFDHGQGVHVGAEGDHRAGLAALEDADDAGLADARPDVEAEPLRWSATIFEVRVSRLPSSGCSCRSRRQATSFVSDFSAAWSIRWCRLSRAATPAGAFGAAFWAGDETTDRRHEQRGQDSQTE